MAKGDGVNMHEELLVGGRDTGPEAVQAYYELKTINLDAPTAALLS
jgi:hypothetical protein